MRKHKSVVAILLAAMMIFTFMPTMAFAQPVKDTTIPSDSELASAGIAKMVVEKEVEWASDYHSAKVYVNGYNSSDALVKSYVANFQLYDKEATVTKDDAGDYFVIIPYSRTAADGAQYTRYVLGVATSKYDKNKDNGGTWKVERLHVNYDWDFSKTKAISDSQAVNVFDASQFASMKVLNKDIKVDAGAYSYWFAHKDEMEGNKAKVANPLASEFGKVNNWKAEDGFYTVTYPEYNAYDYDTEKLKNNVLEAKVELNTEAIKKAYGKAYEVSTAPATVKIEMVVDHIDDNYKLWTVDDAKAWVKANSSAWKADTRTDIGFGFVYDGTSHGITFTNAPKQVSYKYYVAKEDAKGNWTEPTKNPADYADTFAGLKDAGVYHVYVVQILNKTSAQIMDNKVVEVYKAPVELSFKQDLLRTEYGKYTAESLEAAIKELIVVGATVDSADKVAEAVNKYASVEGLFTDAGENTLYASFDNKALAADTELAAALSNYKFGNVYTSKPGNNDGTYAGLRLVIEKVANNINLKMPSKKTFKGSKTTKKGVLKKNQTIKASATSTFGTVTFSKAKGSKKIKVAKNGKITVKKGLKKGTYKVVVKATVQGSANYGNAVAKKTLKVIVKK